MCADDRLKPPNETWQDKTREFVDIGVNALTFGAGGPLLSMNVAPSISRRREQFEHDVADKINRLEEQGRVFKEQLAGNETFVTMYLTATVAALKTHENGKRKALRNAVLNSALPASLDEARQLLFLGHVDFFTAWHICLFKFFQNPRDFAKSIGKPLQQIYSIR